MLKLTVKPGEYIQIGEEIKVIFSGGSANNIHVLIDAPRKYNLLRSKVVDKEKRAVYFRDEQLSQDSRKKIKPNIEQNKKRKNQHNE